MDDYSKRLRSYLRVGIQEAYLCSEFNLKYLEKGPDRDGHLKSMETLVKNYCLLDHRLQIRPNIISRMTAEENAKLARKENAENPDSESNAIPNFNEILSAKIEDAMKKVNVNSNPSLVNFNNKVKKLVNKTDGTGDDDELVVTDVSNNLVDPLTKMKLVDPVISIKCKHSFSRKSVLEHLKNASRCPYVGCSVEINVDDLEEDVIASQALYEMQLRQQLQM